MASGPDWIDTMSNRLWEQLETPPGTDNIVCKRQKRHSPMNIAYYCETCLWLVYPCICPCVHVLWLLIVAFFFSFVLLCIAKCFGPMESEKFLEAGKHREGWGWGGGNGRGRGGGGGGVCMYTAAYVSYCSAVPVTISVLDFSLRCGLLRHSFSDIDLVTVKKKKEKENQIKLKR